MWQVMEVCEQCGSDDIRAVAGDDPSTGYHAEEWRCMTCGANCEYLEPEETGQTEVKAA